MHYVSCYRPCVTHKISNQFITGSVFFCRILGDIVVALRKIRVTSKQIYSEDKAMKDKDTYKNKVQNTFTAYVLKSVNGVRKKYLAKKLRVEIMENYLEEDPMVEPSVHFEEFYSNYKKEELLRLEGMGEYPSWDELSDRNLVAVLWLLKQGERELLFQHIFEEKSFEEISREAGEAKNKIENRYYYAIRKIRKWMEVQKHGF